MKGWHNRFRNTRYREREGEGERGREKPEKSKCASIIYSQVQKREAGLLANQLLVGQYQMGGSESQEDFPCCLN